MTPKLVSLMMLAALLTAQSPALGQTGSETPSRGAITDCLDSECGWIIESLTAQSEADSLTIKELEIKLYWAERRAQDARPSWAERFMSKYGFAVGAAVGVYVGAAAVR